MSLCVCMCVCDRWARACVCVCSESIYAAQIDASTPLPDSNWIEKLGQPRAKLIGIVVVVVVVAVSQFSQVPTHTVDVRFASPCAFRIYKVFILPLTPFPQVLHMAASASCFIPSLFRTRERASFHFTFSLLSLSFSPGPAVCICAFECAFQIAH